MNLISRANNRKERKARKLKNQMLSYNKSPKQKEMPFDQLQKRFFAEKHFNSEGTVNAYKKAVKRAKRANGDFDNFKENTKRFTWRHLKAIYNWGIKKGYVSKNPYEDKPTQSIPKVDYYSDKEITEILKSLGNSKASDLIRFAFLTGARRGELANLSKKDINDHNIILDGKSGRRPFPINEEIRKLIGRGKIFNYNTPNAVEIALYRCGFKLSATKIRHTFATRLVKNGMNLFHVSKLMGHKSVTTTEKYYAHLKPSDAKDYGDYLNINISGNSC